MYFYTGSENKFAEFFELVPGIQRVNMDLPEIQAENGHEVVKAKLTHAAEWAKEIGYPFPLIVEDTSLSIACLNELPGPMVKWWLKAIKSEGIAELVMKYPHRLAVAATNIGVAKSVDQFEFYFGSTGGDIVAPRGKTTFGWDDIFQPHGFTQTYAEMEPWQKNQISHRRKAIEAMKRGLGMYS